jgi:RNA polymerase sigma factor (sigma-70 family)
VFVIDRTQDILDGGILSEVARGNERAMENCIAKYGSLVWAIAKRHVQDHSAVEDIVQETFTDLWKSAKHYDPAIASESTFIGLLSRRRAIDFSRKESRRPQLEPMPEAESLPYAVIESSASLRCDSSDVRAALKELPEETQKIFSLHFDEGMTHPEIVEKTGLPLGTVKTRLRRGLINLRNRLSRLDNPQPFSPANP